MKKQFSSTLVQRGARALVGCLFAAGLALQAQETVMVAVGAGAPGGTNFVFRTGGSGQAGGICINGSDIGSSLLKACDLDQDGKVTLTELKNVAAASFKLWDANADGNLSSNELSAGLKEFFPTPPPGARQRVRVINGVATSVSPDELPTPDAMLIKHILAAADSNQDGLLSPQELNDFLDKSFAQWDQDGNASLDAQELGLAFGQLALPDFRAPAQ